MQRLEDGVIAEVRERASRQVYDIINEHVALKRAGMRYKGLCPFHDEKTPSFTVTPETGMWHCFGCGEGGDAIDFIQKREGGGFRWAVEYLAQRVGITLRYEDNGKPAPRSEPGISRDRIMGVIATTAKYFSAQLLTTPEAHEARELLSARNLGSREIAEHFGCGYAPKGNILVQHLAAAGFTEDEMIQAGVAGRSENGGRVYSFFRNRLTWEIKDSFGRTIGFGARRLDPEDQGKFINTRETPVYKKAQVLFGLSLARKAISATRHVYVVEGYADVMAMHLAGVENTVAACGTAFTAEHLAILLRLVGEDGEITFALDDDAAGRKATLAVYNLAKNSLRRLTVLPASEGLDPDEYRQKHGDAALAALTEQRRPLIETVIRSTLASMPIQTLEDRRVALDALLPLLGAVPDKGLREDYARRVAQSLSISETEVFQRVRVTPADAVPREHSEPPIPSTATPGAIEREILKVLVADEALAVEYLSQTRGIFGTQGAKQIGALIERALGNPHSEPWTQYLRALSNDQERTLLASLTVEDLPVKEEAHRQYILDLIGRLNEEIRQHRIDALKEKIRSSSSTPEERDAALEEFTTLMMEPH